MNNATKTLSKGAVTMSQSGMESLKKSNEQAASLRHVLPKVAGFFVFNLYNARKSVIVKVPAMRSYMDMAAIIGRRAVAMRCKITFIGMSKI